MDYYPSKKRKFTNVIRLPDQPTVQDCINFGDAYEGEYLATDLSNVVFLCITKHLNIPMRA